MSTSQTGQTDHPQDSEYHHEESNMADDIYEDANEVENANITNEGADEGEDGLGAMNDGGNDSFFLSTGS